MHDLADGPLMNADSYSIYFVNGYKFHTKNHSSDRISDNSGVCISGGGLDYYGHISEILEVEYPGRSTKRCVVLKCDWYDPTIGVGTKTHDKYGIVEIHKGRTLNVYEPFILGAQAKQVCYISFPSLRRDKDDWRAVWKVKPRGWLDAKKIDVDQALRTDAFQADVVERVGIVTVGMEDDVPHAAELIESDGEDDDGSDGDDDGSDGDDDPSDGDDDDDEFEDDISPTLSDYDDIGYL